ncbi:MAG: retropepsin-like aspartic protease, partial [Planctomycetota bacterium]|nr:retropepsin-like aspartic protease [Planctomycetota bacterium]
MAVIQKEIRLEGSLGKKEVVALFDSGASYSCLSSETARHLGNIEPLPQLLEFGTAEDGRKVSAKECIRLNFYING